MTHERLVRRMVFDACGGRTRWHDSARQPRCGATCVSMYRRSRGDAASVQSCGRADAFPRRHHRRRHIGGLYPRTGANTHVFPVNGTGTAPPRHGRTSGRKSNTTAEHAEGIAGGTGREARSHGRFIACAAPEHSDLICTFCVHLRESASRLPPLKPTDSNTGTHTETPYAPECDRDRHSLVGIFACDPGRP